MSGGTCCRFGIKCATLLAMALVAACGSNATSPSGTDGVTALSFASQPGDGIGRGQTRRFTPDNAKFAPTANTDRAEVFVEIQEMSGIRWRLDLAAPPGTVLAPGSYSVNEAVSPYFRTGAYLSFSGNGLGCIPVGRFTISRITFGGANVLSALDATFEQRCPESAQGLSGEVHIVDAGASSGSVQDIGGAWSGVFQSDRGFDRFQMTLSQSGSSVTGTWTAAGAGWNGAIEGKIALGAFTGSMSFDGAYPSLAGPRCQGSAPVFAFLDGTQPVYLLSGQFIGTCQYMPIGILWTLQTR